jgi:hypothetical protein
MRYVVKTLDKTMLVKGIPLGRLYEILVKLVRKNPEQAKRKFPHGIPDAANRKVEFKIGLDRLHGSQFVWNVLNGHDSKVRWFPSYDAIEDFIQGRKSKGKIFRSYKEFILWKYGQ